MLSTTNSRVTIYNAMIAVLTAIGGLLAILLPTDCLRSLGNRPPFQRAFRQSVGNPEAIRPLYDKARWQGVGNYEPGTVRRGAIGANAPVQGRVGLRAQIFVNLGGAMQKKLTLMVYNILNGDSLAYSFPDAKIEGGIVVVREALIDGALSGDNLPEFWRSRAKHMRITAAEYNNFVVKEFEKIMNAPDDSVFNLWFEYDLFCQVNMWFVISIINSLPIKKKVFAVYTSYLDKTNKHFWNGFGPANSDELTICYANRIPLSEADLNFGQALWEAYKNGNLSALTNLSKRPSLVFPYLQEVVKAHVDRFPKDGTKGRPESVIEDITKNISTDFQKVFTEFWNRESIYGFGDSQLKSLYDKVMHPR